MSCACKSGASQKPKVRQVVKKPHVITYNSGISVNTVTKKPTIRRIIRTRH